MLIGELAAATGVHARTLRFYESVGLLSAPPRTAGGYRDYPVGAVGLVAFIKQAQASGLTLAQIGQILSIRDDGAAPCDHVATLVEQRLEEISDRLDELERTRAELRALRDRLAELDPTECGEDDICVAISRG